MVADAEPKKKHSRRRFDEEKELHFEHSRNGYKRKRKDMSNGSGNDRNHRDKDKSHHKRKLERSPSEKESGEKTKPKVKKKPVHAQKVSKTEAKSVSDGAVDKKKKKKKVPNVPADPPRAPAVVKPVKVKKPDPPKPKSHPVKKEKEKEKIKPKAKEKEKVVEVKAKVKQADPPQKADVPKKPDVVRKAEVVEKEAPSVTVKVVPPSAAPKTQVARAEAAPPPPAPPAPDAKKRDDDAKQKSAPKEVKQETVKEKPNVKKADLKQGKADTLEPPPPPATKPSVAKEPVKKTSEKVAAPKEAKPGLKIEIPEPAPPKPKAEAKPEDVPVKKGSTEVIPKPEVKSAEKKRKRDDAKTPKDKAAVTTPAAHRPPKRVASLKCPGVNAMESSAESKDASRQGKNDAQEENKDWVQCERCKEWFVLPSSINPATLPDHWYCEMKTWGSKNSKCCPPDKDAKRTSKPAQVQSNGKKRNRAAADKNARSNHNQRRAKNQVQSSRPRISNIMTNGSVGEVPSKANPRSSWKWVMCETCNQWRKVPPEVDLEKLPEKWYCSMNKWDPARASCSAPQEADETQTQGVKTVSSKKFVTLPDGVNMYGGQVRILLV